MKKVSIKQVASEAGVSTATISRVLTGNEFVSEEMKAKVYAAIEKLNYRPNEVARSLKQDKTYTIGVIIPDISNPFFMSVLRGVEDVVHMHRYNLIFSSSDEDSDKEKELIQLLLDKRVDGLVLATTGQNETVIKSIAKTGSPLVLIDRELEGNDHEVDLVTEDNVSAAYLLTKALLDKGHRRIAVINGLLNVSTGRDRYAGYLRAISEAGITEDPLLIYDGGFSVEGGIRAVDYFMKLSTKPSAILSFNNNMTFGALQALRKLKFRIPDDILVASYGFVEQALLLNNPEIIYIQQFPYEMGRKIGDTLIKRIQSKNEQALPTKYYLPTEMKQI
jgi:LacI family transcriptional regulator